MEQNGVVSVFDPASFEIVWKDIPDYPNHEANNLGLIRIKRNKKLCGMSETRTSKGTYLSGPGKNVHILVCAAFHGPSPGNGYEVNHIDGNKHNNLPSNLEWVTRGENIAHAYAEGLRKENRKIIVHDHLENTSTEYPTMTDIARLFEITPSACWSLITNHREKRYLDRYTFEFVQGHTVGAKFPWVKDIYALDYSTKTLLVFPNLADAELGTGVKRGTIAWDLQRNSKALIKGYVFGYYGDLKHFPNYSDEQVEISKVQTQVNRGTPLKVTDILSNTTKYYGSMPDLAKGLGLNHPHTLRNKLKTDVTYYENYRIEKLSCSLTE